MNFQKNKTIAIPCSCFHFFCSLQNQFHWLYDLQRLIWYWRIENINYMVNAICRFKIENQKRKVQTKRAHRGFNLWWCIYQLCMTLKFSAYITSMLITSMRYTTIKKWQLWLLVQHLLINYISFICISTLL